MRGQETGQFGSFDGLDNRRELLILFQRLGQHLPAPLADQRRAQWLLSLVKRSVGPWHAARFQLEPCCAVEAYRLCVAICGCLDVSIDEAARLLDETVRRQ
jgi:hypothetical protein